MLIVLLWVQLRLKQQAPDGLRAAGAARLERVHCRVLVLLLLAQQGRPHADWLVLRLLQLPQPIFPLLTLLETQEEESAVI